MGKKLVTRRELLDRWRGIEEEDDDDRGHDLLKRRRLRQLKEGWSVFFGPPSIFLVDSSS